MRRSRAEGGEVLAEDLLLLLIDDESGRRSTDQTRLDYGLGGALLVELAARGAITVDTEPTPRRRRVTVVDAGPTGDDLLDKAVAVIAEKPRRAADLVPRLSKGTRAALLARLVDRGVLRHDEGRILGIFPRHSWPTRDAGHEAEIRTTLSAVLVDGLEPDETTTALVALLSALDQAHKIVGDRLDSAAQRRIRDRAKAIGDGAWGADATRAAVQAAQDATNAAVMAAVIGGTAASAGSAT